MTRNVCPECASLLAAASIERVGDALRLASPVNDGSALAALRQHRWHLMETMMRPESAPTKASMSSGGSTSRIAPSTPSSGSASRPGRDDQKGVVAQSTFWEDERDVAARSLWAPADDRVDRLAAAPWKVVDVETTALTPWSEPVTESLARSARAAVGLPRSGPVDTRPRLRVVTAAWPADDGTLETAAWDLDALTPADRRRVAAACLRGVLVGHNAGFDLFWLRHVVGADAAAWPDEVVDTLLLARLARPDAPLELLDAASRDDSGTDRVMEARHLAEGLMDAHKPKGGWSLEALAWLVLGRRMDKTWQGPAHWTLPVPLREPLYRYAIGDVDVAFWLWMALVGGDPGDDPLRQWAAWKEAHPAWNATAMGQQIRDVVAIREAGLPLSAEAAHRYAHAQEAKAMEAVDRLAELAPELSPWVEDLKAGKGVSEEFRTALAASLRGRGAGIGTTATGKAAVSRKALKRASHGNQDADAVRKAWDAVGALRKRRDMALDYAARLAPDGRIHPLLAHGPISGRLSSQEPNIQNLPHDPDFRAIVEAPPGWRILAADYAAQEMRVAAALALRAQEEILAVIASQDPNRDKLRRWLRAVLDGGVDPSPQEVRARWDEIGELRRARKWREAERAERVATWTELALRLRQVLRASGNGLPYSTLRELLASGLDIHVGTACLINEMPLPASPEEAARFKAEHKALRDRAKGANFGLLYGMGADGFRTYAQVIYDLELSEQDAVDLRERWFAALPELRVWQLWTLATPSERGRWLLVRNGPGGEPRRRPFDIWRVRTLLNRPFSVWKSTQALNLQDQGSGADMTMLAIRRLWELAPDTAARVVGQVHDEILICSPDAEAERDAAALQRAMTDAGNRVLGRWGVPIGEIEIKRDRDGTLPRVWMK
ncbi:putative POLAc domain-containing protein [Candidatus Hydrogenisulfobacillus filiaventi]|uniref:DNA-directed DNA polymerase n=1 Tax=Candidatus Hydrogenisulfobacillus filiaventi TaxID=2707344 RepID=A0A6F8ZIY7_9FIRM|nr:putative POLAc domain-containing protein [Candidatus Hydrogenisulfobacillus filiaventi]